MRISEIYLSIQGEGPRVGRPTVFVRFGGCNLRCPGWPCDTPHAIFASLYRHEWKRMTPGEILQAIEEAADGNIANICFTGGEPMLQPSREMDELIDLLGQSVPPGVELEMFSNGTLEYTKKVLEHVNIIMDWKLPGSGELSFEGHRVVNFKRLVLGDVVKFTIKDEHDFHCARQIFESQQQLNFLPNYYAGVAWGQPFKDADLIKLIFQYKLPWMHTMQVHNYVWDREQRGI